MKLLARLEKQSKLFWVIMGVLLISAVGVVDFITGYEFAFSFFYLIPIALITWFTNRPFGVVTSFLSALVWLITDMAAGVSYSSSIIYIWNTLIALSFFLIVTFLLSALKTAWEQQKKLAYTDSLTNAANSRYFLGLLETEINHARQSKQPFTLAYIDIDNFKAVNDQFGHAIGDEVLRTFVDQTQKSLRKTDVIARLGGDEFAILFPVTDQDAAQIVIAKIQQDILDRMNQNHWTVTFSMGALTCIATPQTINEIIKMADDLMYSVKHDHKNGVKFSIYRY